METFAPPSLHALEFDGEALTSVSFPHLSIICVHFVSLWNIFVILS